MARRRFEVFQYRQVLMRLRQGDTDRQQAIDSKLAYTGFLALLIQDEVARREKKKFELRPRRATFRAQNTRTA